jgi:aminopeptidase N
LCEAQAASQRVTYGALVGGKAFELKLDPDKNFTWTYTEGVPIPAYCMVIAAGEYAQSGPATTGITSLSYYVPKSDASRAVLGFATAQPSLKFCSETIAPYPYEKLALIVGATKFGGMENSSAIVFQANLLSPRNGARRTSRTFNIDAGLEEVVAHEIAHQWWGQAVGWKNYHDQWLSEGFAEYSGILYTGHRDKPSSARELIVAHRDTMKDAPKTMYGVLGGKVTADCPNLGQSFLIASAHTDPNTRTGSACLVPRRQGK